MNRDKVILSIVVAAYNSENTIRRCIDSILNQKFTDFELIIVNDGSTDNTPVICAEYERRDSRVKVISQVNMGLISARKSGVENSCGNVIGFVDSDDWIDSNMYQELIHIYNKYNCQLQEFFVNLKMTDIQRSMLTIIQKDFIAIYGNRFIQACYGMMNVQIMGCIVLL